MTFKDKVMKAIVELGQEKNVATISEAISTRAFFSLKNKFEVLQQKINENHAAEINKRLENFDKDLTKRVKEIIKNESN